MEFLGNIPQPLYKYRVWTDPYQKKVLTDAEVYLAAAEQFNDPFDANIPYRFKDEDLTPENIFQKLWDIGKKQWPDISDAELSQKCYDRQHSGAFENGQYWKDEYEAFKQDMNDKFGILSLTSKNDNLLMWSHYANSHTGFCIGFDKFHLYNTINGSLGPVIYNDQLPRVGIFDDTPQGLTRLLTTKSLDWKYEDEYRLVKIFASKKVFKLPNEAITEIVLGHKMQEVHKQEILKVAEEKYPNAKLFQSVMNLESYKMDIIPIIKPIAIN